MQLKNLVYIFDERYCASKLTLSFLDYTFNISHRLEDQFVKDLQQQIKYVSANDLKKDESR